MRKTVLKIEHLCKRFGPTIANHDISLEIDAGEVIGLAGENGSGKSTLLSQIAGIYRNDSGTMTLHGESYSPASALEANSRGIAMVVQELGTVTCLNAGNNIFLGKMKQFERFGIVDFGAMDKKIRQICERWGIPQIDSREEMGRLDVESKKMVELVRALSTDPQILILDEITQSLSQNNRSILFSIIKKFREEGRIVLLITHDVEEMLQISDRILVLRDGEIVNEMKSAETTVDEVKQKMVGRQINHGYYREDQEASDTGAVVLTAKGLSVAGRFQPLDLELHAGEILGFCGLSDSGIHDVGKALYGVETDGRKGSVLLNHSNKEVKNARQALKSKIGYLPKERDHDCLMLKACIKDNFSLASLREMKGKLGFISSRKLDRNTQQLVRYYQVKCSDIYQSISHLSGGNKQKVNVGRWMAKDLDVLILDCPTRGVDVGVKAYIYQLMKQAKEAGIAMILISDELTEVLGMSDRIIVMKNGAVVSRLERGTDFTEEKVIEVMV